MSAPLLPRVYDDDGDIGWENHSTTFFKKKIGAEAFKALKKKQFNDVPDTPGGSMSVLGMKLTRLFGSQHSAILSGDKKFTSDSGLPHPVGGAGFATIVNHPKFPDHDFFRPGRHFRVRLRHANLSFGDDAMLDGRVAGIKFWDEDEGGPLDLLLHTGRVAPFHSAASFDEFVTAFAGGEDTLADWCHKQPSTYFGRVENVRRNPESYYDQRYYSHVVYEYVTSDGLRHMAKLRLLPASGEEETGLPNEDDQKHPWIVSRLKGETRSADYLRNEYNDRLRKHPLQYRLQIQLRAWENNTEFVNPCMSWSTDQYPWYDLAVITIALPLTEQCLAQTKLSITNYHNVFKLPPTTGKLDFFSLAHAMCNLYKTYSLAEKDLAQKTAKYEITVKTGLEGNAGTDADVYIVITGTLKRTNPIFLDTPMHDDFEAGQIDKFNVTATDVGDITMIQMSMRTVIPGCSWLLDLVTVTNLETKKTSHFPCNQWLTTTQCFITLRSSDALLVHQELTPYCYLQRKFEIENRRKEYQWQKVQGLPSRLKADRYEDIPREARFHQSREHDLRVKFMQTLANTGIGTIRALFDTWDPLTDSEKLLTSILKNKQVVRKVAECWQDDVEFGRQFLNGTHPVKLRRMKQPLISFPVKDEDLYGLMDRGLTLKEEIKAGHIYFVSYPELERTAAAINHLHKASRFIAAPICMFYVKSTGELVPVAIQLSQRPGQDQVLYTPKDNETDWLFAKMWLRLADSQLHHIEARHLKLHLVMEVFTIATMRNLPAVHPVYKLLVPHLRYTIAINHIGRQSLYPADDGLFEKYLSIGTHFKGLLTETYKKFRLQSLNFPISLEDRGVDDPVKLPNYWYRQDGLALWGILKKFVRTMLMLHYWSDQNVQTDEEIQAWIRDMHLNGFPEWDDGTDHGVPPNLVTLDQLITLVTMIIFNATVQNAALTLPMIDYYGFPANAPTMLTVPPPYEKGSIGLEVIKNALPPRSKMAEILAACYTLSRISAKERGLGLYPEHHISGDAPLVTIEAFKEDLEQFTQRVIARNASLTIPYTYLQPDGIPSSVVA